MALSGQTYESRAELIDKAVVAADNPSDPWRVKAQAYALVAIAQCLNELTRERP